MKRNNSGGDERIGPSSQAKRGSLRSTLSEIASVSLAILREIFDESAYQRFLDRARLQSSPSAYALFQRENEQAKSQRPRCC
jgi:hypothetical protein